MNHHQNTWETTYIVIKPGHRLMVLGHRQAALASLHVIPFSLKRCVWALPLIVPHSSWLSASATCSGGWWHTPRLPPTASSSWASSEASSCITTEQNNSLKSDWGETQAGQHAQRLDPAGFPAAHLFGSLALGSGRSRRRWDVGDDTWLRHKVLFDSVERVWFQLVPSQVDQAQTWPHHNQHFIVLPDVSEAHGEGPNRTQRTIPCSIAVFGRVVAIKTEPQAKGLWSCKSAIFLSFLRRKDLTFAKNKIRIVVGFLLSFNLKLH